jgi:ABC-type transporter Mla subunit MlaD
VENKPTRRSKKIHTATAGMLCLATLTTGACVTRSTYAVAVADLEATKAELDSIHIQSQVLTDQVSELQQLKIDLASQMETATSAVQQAKQKMEAEHAASQKQLSTLHRMIRQLAAQQNSLRYALQRANAARPPLQSLVERYRSELGEAAGPGAPLSPPPVERTDQPAKTALAPPGQVAVQTDPAPNPTVTTPAAPPNPTAANPTPQPTNKPSSEPVKADWLSMLKGWIISLWRSIFSPAE